MALAIIFDSIGVGEWLVLLAVVLVVVGPKRLPATARTIGKHYAKFRRAADSFKRQLMEMDNEFNSVVDDAQREVESAVGVDDFTEGMPDDSISGEHSFDGEDSSYDPSADDYEAHSAGDASSSAGDAASSSAGDAASSSAGDAASSGDAGSSSAGAAPSAGDASQPADGATASAGGSEPAEGDAEFARRGPYGD